MLQVSPKASVLLSRLPLTLASPQTDAVSLIQHLIQFGQDIPGRAAVTLLIQVLIEDMGEGADATYLQGLFEAYPLDQSVAKTPVRILFLSANPSDTTRLRLESEYREIDDVLLKSQYRERFSLAIRPALRVTDLQEALLRYQPRVVHFSGHGSETAALIFENNAGKLMPVNQEAVAELFGALGFHVAIVVLNACYSAAQAEQILPHVDCVIGMSQSIGDPAAIAFSAAFYRALAYGVSIQSAFDLGCNQIRLQGISGASIPVLYGHPSADLRSVRLI
jgi:hypothetical protein